MTESQCEMSPNCTAEVEMIGDKGYVYCAGHGIIRRAHGHERTRMMRPWELALIAEGHPLPHYEALPRRESQCAYVLDGTDTDWYRCTTHDELAPSKDAPCEGYHAPAYKGHE